MYRHICGIYKITNKINGKCYIGQSINVRKRWESHKVAMSCTKRDDYEYPLYQDMRKYGIENFSFEIIEECAEEELNKKEIYYIELFDAFENGYNQTEGGLFRTYCHKLSEIEVDEIKGLLRSTLLSQIEISNMYHVSQQIINYINTGSTYFDEDEIYPIRKFSIIRDKRIPRSFCPVCGKPIFIKKHKYCSQECACAGHRKISRPSREELKVLIRETSFLQIGKQFGVSNVAVSKWCKQYNLPYKSSEIKKYTDEEWKNI